MKHAPASEQQSVRLWIKPWTVTRALIIIVAFLTCASVAGQAAKYFWGIERAGGLIPGFDLDREANFPNWYQSTTLFCCSVFLSIIAVVTKRRRGPRLFQWGFLAFVFLMMSIDEEVSLHERLIEPLHNGLHTSGFLLYAWVIPGMIFVIGMAWAYWRFLKDLPPTTRKLFLIAGIIYVGGAVGMEMVGGEYRTLHGVENFHYAMLANLEEFLEMAGIIVFIYALLAYLGRLGTEVSVRPFAKPGALSPGKTAPAEDSLAVNFKDAEAAPIAIGK